MGDRWNFWYEIKSFPTFLGRENTRHSKSKITPAATEMKIAAILPEEKVVVDEEPEAKRAEAWDVDGSEEELLLTTLDVMNPKSFKKKLNIGNN